MERSTLKHLVLDRAWLDRLALVAAKLGLGLSPSRLAAELHALSEAYNHGDFERSRTRGAMSARLLFSFARDVPKMGAAVRELLAVGKLRIPEGRALRVLDVGAGLGASTWGLARALGAAGAQGALHATLVDRDAGMLEIARAVGPGRERNVDVELVTTREIPRERFDVVLLGQVLSEIATFEERCDLVKRLALAHTSDSGSVVIVEPALRDRTRALHELRDRMIAGGMTVFAPCLHAEPCPALVDSEAWCHEDLPIDLPAELVSLARAANLRWQGLTFTYLVLRKDGVTLRSALAAQHAARVVSSPIDTKGKRDLFLCGDFVANERLVSLRRKVTRLDRDGTRDDAWQTATRGDVLEFEPGLAADVARVPKDVRVRH